MFRKSLWMAGTFAAILMILGSLYSGLKPYPGWERYGSELTALTTALYWEGALLEPREGLHAKAWVIFNRVRSAHYPDTIREVVAEGTAPGKIDSCQFSFACDGQPETPERLCELRPKDEVELLGWSGCEGRWMRYLALSSWWLYVYRGSDPTEGATLYYASWLPKRPYWADDMVPELTKKIGSHIFAPSLKRGSDVARN